MENTNEKTRERYIKAYLNEQTSEYVLNRDYGKTTEREHYHAIAKPKNQKGLICYSAYKYGHIKAEKINQLKRFTRNNKSIKEIANDLLIHATKSSTKNARIIYSREQKKTLYNKVMDYYNELNTDNNILEIDEILQL